MSNDSSSVNGIVLDTAHGPRAIVSCGACHVTFGCHPDHVPSIRVNGPNLPICQSCLEKWNEMHRTSRGLAPIKAHPDAYFDWLSLLPPLD